MSLGRPASIGKRLGDLADMMLGGRVEFTPDGARPACFSVKWAQAFLVALLDGETGVGEITVNALDDGVWALMNGVQRLGAVFAFITGMIPVYDGDSRLFWTWANEAPTGASYLFNVGNETAGGSRLHAGSAAWRPRHLYMRLCMLLGLDMESILAERGRPGSGLVGPGLRAAFLDVPVAVKVLPGWPERDAALHAISFGESAIPSTPASLVYRLPGLGKLKSLEEKACFLSRAFKLENSDDVFCDLVRVAMYCHGCGNVPFANSPDLADTVRRWVLGLPGDLEESLVAEVELGMVRLRDSKLCGMGERPLAAITRDVFVAGIVAGVELHGDADAMNGVVCMFLCKSKKEMSNFLDANEEARWRESHTARNMVPALVVAIAAAARSNLHLKHHNKRAKRRLT